MRHRILRALGLAALLPAIAAAQPSPNSPAAKARADNGRPPFTAADVSFMSGMIGHHAQAVVMAGWAPTHGASRAVQALAERIVVAQRDEIAYMQRWLRERAQPVPAGDAMHDTMPGMAGMAGMAGMRHDLMPGMLTPEQLAALNAARGADFDRLFLQDMIQHHQGALTMVQRLLAATGAAQDDDVYRFVADVSADQTTEIDRMNTMLDAMPKKP
jgi:uncharacterized protein (DUF305 family)